jgi:SAM-dependent methyltransferase
MQTRDKSFDRIARSYDELRPGYPEELYDRIISYGALTNAERVLEVGVGTGKATPPLAIRGYRITGVEPGENLVAIARANLAAFPNVEIKTTTFEAWDVDAGAFGLAFSAQAFHWLNAEQRLPKFARALKRNGVLALFGHAPTIAEGSLRADLNAAYEREAPALCARADQSWYASGESLILSELRESRLFSDATFEVFEWQRPLSAASYCALQATYSDHSALPPVQLAALLTATAAVIEEHGGTISVSYKTGLFLARASTQAEGTTT